MKRPPIAATVAERTETPPPRTASPRYTSSMSVVLFGMRLLEVMFFVGIAGSAIVVVIASAEDMKELLSKTKHIHPAEETPPA
jgi:hypothetical protein